MELLNGKNGKKIIVGQTFNSPEEAFKFLSKKEENNKTILIVNKKEDFDALRKRFFDKRDLIRKDEFVSYINGQSKELNDLKQNAEIVIRYGDQSIDALYKPNQESNITTLPDQEFFQENSYIRRLVKRPGEIMYFGVSNDQFVNIKHLCNETKESTLFSLDRVIQTLSHNNAPDMFWDLYANAPCVFVSEKGEEYLAYYRQDIKSFSRVKSPRPSIDIMDAIPEDGKLCSQNKEQAFYYAFLHSDIIDWTFAEGSAGSGKTLMALNAGITLHKKTKCIRIFRPTTESGQSIGWLPGDKAQKTGNLGLIVSDLYYNVLKLDMTKYPLLINELIPGLIDKVIDDKEKDRIEKAEGLADKLTIIDIVNTVQGRNLVNETIIVDEAQNFSDNDLETILSRALGNSKIVCVGDWNRFQRKLVNPNDKGLLHYMKRMAGLPNIACIRLPRCVRNPNIDQMISAVH